MTAPVAPPTAPTDGAGSPPSARAAAPAAPGFGRPRRRWVRWVAVGAGLLVLVVGALALLSVPDYGRPPPFSPTSEWPDGTKGLVMLLEAEGADVEIAPGAPDDVDDLAGVDVVLLPFDFIADLSQSFALDEWVDQGGRLVVTDHLSRFTAIVADGTTTDATLGEGSCTIDALAGVDEITPGRDAPLYDTFFGEGRCFTQGGEAFVVAADQGEGTVVSLGSISVFTNELLDDSGNAGLAVALLAPRPGTTVRYLDLDLSAPPPERPEADVPNPLAGFFEMVPPAARAALIQLIVAFLAYAWWRGRRLGRPVLEPQPVEIEGSELVAAVGRLLERSRDPARAAELLRADLRRSLADRLGLPRDVSDDILVEAAASRAGIDPARVRAALVPGPHDAASSVLLLADLIESVRSEVLHGSTP